MFSNARLAIRLWPIEARMYNVLECRSTGLTASVQSLKRRRIGCHAGILICQSWKAWLRATRLLLVVHGQRSRAGDKSHAGYAPLCSARGETRIRGVRSHPPAYGPGLSDSVNFHRHDYTILYMIVRTNVPLPHFTVEHSENLAAKHGTLNSDLVLYRQPFVHCNHTLLL